LNLDIRLLKPVQALNEICLSRINPANLFKPINPEVLMVLNFSGSSNKSGSSTDFQEEK
jgi:hypothetical protein